MYDLYIVLKYNFYNDVLYIFCYNFIRTHSYRIICLLLHVGDLGDPVLSRDQIFSCDLSLITWPLRPHPRLRIECGSDTANTYSTCVDGYNGNVLPVHMNRPVSRWGRLLWILNLVMRARWTLFVWGENPPETRQCYI